MTFSAGKTFGGETREMPPLWGEGRPVRPDVFNQTGRMAVLPKIAQPKKPEFPDNGVHLEIGSRQIVLPRENQIKLRCQIPQGAWHRVGTDCICYILIFVL